MTVFNLIMYILGVLFVLLPTFCICYLAINFVSAFFKKDKNQEDEINK